MKNKQGITIAALIIAIVGLSIGFAAFSNTLTISSSATVNPSAENFKVVFAKNTNVQSLDTTNVTPTKNLDNVTGFTAEDAVINNEALNGPALTHLKANFTAPGQSVTYTLNVVNAGAYVAYLKELAFANATNATGSETYKHCYAATTDSNGDDIPAAQQATPSLVTQACNGIDISVTIGTASDITPLSASKSLGNQALQANGGNVQATITISYDSNAAYVDGPMEVEFGDISFTASSNQGSNQGSQEQGGGNEQQGGQETPTSATVTLTKEQIISGQKAEHAFVIDMSTLFNSEEIQSLKNNMTLNSDVQFFGSNIYYFNDITCSDNAILDISGTENAARNYDDEDEYNNQHPSYYSVNYLTMDNTDYIYVYVVKNGAELKNDNKDNDQDRFDGLTFTITGSDS